MESGLSVTNTCPWLLDDVFFACQFRAIGQRQLLKILSILNNILDIEEKKENITNSPIFIVLQD